MGAKWSTNILTIRHLNKQTVCTLLQSYIVIRYKSKSKSKVIPYTDRLIFFATDRKQILPKLFAYYFCTFFVLFMFIVNSCFRGYFSFSFFLVLIPTSNVDPDPDSFGPVHPDLEV